MAKAPEVTPGGIVYPRDREQEKKAAEHFGPIEIRNADDHKRLGEMMAEILHMGGFRGGGICLEPGTKSQTKARRRLWRHFADELLGVDWDCEELC